MEYLIVGGTAVAFYGYDRITCDINGAPAIKHDLDFWYNPSYANYYKLLNALESLSLDVSRFKKEKAPDPHKSFFRFELAQFTLDFLPEISGLSKFRTAYAAREISKIGSVEISVLSLEDLLGSKETNSRPKDIIDIAMLKSIRDTGEDQSR